MLGIALGITVLITVLSVMNGFDTEIKNRIFSLTPQITIRNLTGNIPNWSQFLAKQKDYPGVVAAAPFISGQGMLQGEGTIQPTLILGVDPKQEKQVSQIPDKMLDGKFADLIPGNFNIVLGEKLAENLGASVGDKVTLYTLNPAMTPAGIIPRVKRFKVVAIFKTGNGFGFDSELGFINLSDAQILYEMENTISGVNLKIQDPYLAPQMGEKIVKNLAPEYVVTDWTNQYGPLFKAIKLEKTMMFFILLLIIAVAAFNLVATLVMVVSDKQADIAILRTLGATPIEIMKIFIVQGFIIGISGMILGLIGGTLLASNATAIVNQIENLFHIQLLSSSVYYVNYLPSKIAFSDLAKVCFSAIILSLIATLYPAYRASKVQPAEALRYE